VQLLGYCQNEKEAKVKAEPKTICTTDVDAPAILLWRCCWSDKSPFHSNRITVSRHI